MIADDDDDIVQSTVSVSCRLLLLCHFHAQLFDLIRHFSALFVVVVRYAKHPLTDASFLVAACGQGWVYIMWH